MYFLFINALWMIVTSIILLYTDSLISIDIEIPRGLFWFDCIFGWTTVYDVQRQSTTLCPRKFSEINQCGVIDDEDEDEAFHVIRYKLFDTNNFDLIDQSSNITESPFLPTFPPTLRTTTAAEEKPRVIKLQPFSVIFLMFYIILISTQFICMLWHR